MMDVARSEGAPACLDSLREGCWTEPECKCRLYEDFLGKCYLCESSIFLGVLEVDHRVPQADPAGVDLRFHWSNLFPACRSCNGRRSKRWPTDGLLFPDRDGVEARLDQRLEWVGSELVARFLAVSPDDAAARNSAEELGQLHLLPGGRRRIDKADDLRAAITAQYALVSEKEREYRNARAEHGAEDLRTRRAEDLLRFLLSRRSPYTMLLRSKFPEYAHLFD